MQDPTLVYFTSFGILYTGENEAAIAATTISVLRRTGHLYNVNGQFFLDVVDWPPALRLSISKT
jgi:hypothetical protein